jgi:hypothetical protein
MFLLDEHLVDLESLRSNRIGTLFLTLTMQDASQKAKRNEDFRLGIGRCL